LDVHFELINVRVIGTDAHFDSIRRQVSTTGGGGEGTTEGEGGREADRRDGWKLRAKYRSLRATRCRVTQNRGSTDDDDDDDDDDDAVPIGA